MLVKVQPTSLSNSDHDTTVSFQEQFLPSLTPVIGNESSVITVPVDFCHPLLPQGCGEPCFSRLSSAIGRKRIP